MVHFLQNLKKYKPPILQCQDISQHLYQVNPVLTYKVSDAEPR
jgi:hypothetical protein